MHQNIKYHSSNPDVMQYSGKVTVNVDLVLDQLYK